MRLNEQELHGGLYIKLLAAALTKEYENRLTILTL